MTRTMYILLMSWRLPYIRACDGFPSLKLHAIENDPYASKCNVASANNGAAECVYNPPVLLHSPLVQSLPGTNVVWFPQSAYLVFHFWKCPNDGQSVASYLTMMLRLFVKLVRTVGTAGSVADSDVLNTETRIQYWVYIGYERVRNDMRTHLPRLGKRVKVREELDERARFRGRQPRLELCSPELSHLGGPRFMDKCIFNIISVAHEPQFAVMVQLITDMKSYRHEILQPRIITIDQIVVHIAHGTISLVRHLLLLRWYIVFGIIWNIPSKDVRQGVRYYSNVTIQA
ncbi:hypothetical protein F5887DRAFT_1166421 [Amanita rubescens]|nr:hypothetical protein F5887DRAFT_1166421 [Amanita rubescens]